MKQVLQNLKDGSTYVEDVPAPRLNVGQFLINTRATLISAGTERMLLDFGKANALNKARQQPDKVRAVLDKARSDGLNATFEAVQSKLDQPLALGYCNVGTIAQIGGRNSLFQIGGRVVNNGPHAQIVSVPFNLCAPVPDNISDEQAIFTVPAAIGLQAIRLINPTLGENIVVIGLGLIGLLSVQILKAQGCRVLGIDFDNHRLDLAKKFGAEIVNAKDASEILAASRQLSRGRGVDGVIIATSSTSNEPIKQSTQMCRKRGRIVLVGTTGLKLSRSDFYEKEISFQVSCSYGPGRHDQAYEQQGHDYPIGFVRWTEQRNFEAILDLLSSGRLDTGSLISHKFRFEETKAAYSLLSSDEQSMGIMLQFNAGDSQSQIDRDMPVIGLGPRTKRANKANIAFLGAGNYAGRTLIPAFKAAGANLHTITSNGGVSAIHYGKKYGFECATSQEQSLFADQRIDTIVIATRHNAHANLVLEALRADKHVFCEKPLCLTLKELNAIEKEIKERPDQILMLGFNRRFSPLTLKMKSLLDSSIEPKSFIMTVNAGHIGAEHWTQDKLVGGGRIIGEACHYIDLLRHLADAPILHHHQVCVGPGHASQIVDDRATITLQFGDGSIGTIHYMANGHKAVAKVRLEVFCAGKVLQLNNFRSLKGWGWPGFSKMNLWRQDKGNSFCVQAFVDALKNGTKAPIEIDEILESSRISIAVANALAQ